MLPRPPDRQREEAVLPQFRQRSRILGAGERAEESGIDAGSGGHARSVRGFAGRTRRSEHGAGDDRRWNFNLRVDHAKCDRLLEFRDAVHARESTCSAGGGRSLKNFTKIIRCSMYVCVYVCGIFILFECSQDDEALQFVTGLKLIDDDKLLITSSRLQNFVTGKVDETTFNYRVMMVDDLKRLLWNVCSAYSARENYHYRSFLPAALPPPWLRLYNHDSSSSYSSFNYELGFEH